MNAVLVCVDYADLLEVTLPYNRHHFNRILIVTAPQDHRTIDLAYYSQCDFYVTDAFYRDGAIFNKWLALEEALDKMEYRQLDDWMCLMDADVLWPRKIPEYPKEIGCLYTPLRRMFEDVLQPIPEESQWKNYPIHPNIAEWAGYSQIFHPADPHLGPPPWHEVDWKHAGGADSFFQFRWPSAQKIRPPFEVLHLGPAGENWCGRATIRRDGSQPEEAQERRKKMVEIWKGRRGKAGPERFRQEKL
jgi:hypothetical protein